MHQIAPLNKQRTSYKLVQTTGLYVLSFQSYLISKYLISAAALKLTGCLTMGN